VCDPRLCNDSQARCAATIFLRSPFSVLCSPCLISRLTPRSPSPLSVLVLAAHSRPHRSSPLSPSAIVAASSRQRANARRQHTGIYASPGPHLRVLESSGSRPLSLSLSLCHLGHIPELGTQAPFCITEPTSYAFTGLAPYTEGWLVFILEVSLLCSVVSVKIFACVGQFYCLFKIPRLQYRDYTRWYFGWNVESLLPGVYASGLGTPLVVWRRRHSRIKNHA